MSKRIYISGPITGIENYWDKFKDAEVELVEKGYKVINPACIDDVMQGGTWEEYMKVDMCLLSMCDAIYMLDGWETSCGANREYGYAMGKGMEILSDKTEIEKVIIPQNELE